jgi:competence protein ComEC
LAFACAWTAARGARLLVDSANLVDWLPFLNRRVPGPDTWTVVIYAAALTGAIFANRLASVPGRLRAKIRRGGALVGLGMALWIIFAPQTWRWPWRADGKLHVTSIDVGQGDATFIQFPDATTMVVDAGGLGADARFDVGARVVAPVLWHRRVGWVDGLLLTHGDPDHIGGAMTLLDVFRPPRLWEGIEVPGHAPMQRLRDRAQQLGVIGEPLHAGAGWTRGAVAIRIWHPPPADWERRKVRNDDSVVVELRFGGVSIVLPGDIGRDVERDLVSRAGPARLRVLKVPHHGSATSSSDAFLDALRPAIAVVSCGRSNRFGHPAPVVLARYRARHIAIFRTDEDGQIDLSTDGTSLDVQTFTGRTATFR